MKFASKGRMGGGDDSGGWKCDYGGSLEMKEEAEQERESVSASIHRLPPIHDPVCFKVG